MKDSQFNTLVQMIAALSDRIEEIAQNQEKFATKEDLKRFATKEDLKRFATKEDLKRFATKEDLKRFATKKDLKRDLESNTNTILTVIHEHLAPIEHTVEQHNKRITRLEKAAA